jgi:hypothetical protein
VKSKSMMPVTSPSRSPIVAFWSRPLGAEVAKSVKSSSIVSGLMSPSWRTWPPLWVSSLGVEGVGRPDRRIAGDGIAAAAVDLAGIGAVERIGLEIGIAARGLTKPSATTMLGMVTSMPSTVSK